jgi:hypothetical protein
MTEAVGGWVLGHLQTLIWGYISAHWLGIAAFLIGATAVSIAIRKLLALYGYLPLIIGVAMLIIAAWALGYNTAPVRTVRVPVIKTETVEVKVVDDTEIKRLRGILAGKDSEIAQAVAARRRAEAAMARLEQELAAAKSEIQRLLAELAKPPVVVALVEEFNAMCPWCGHLSNIADSMKHEQVRCGNCKAVASVRTYWARRAYVLDRQRKQQ